MKNVVKLVQQVKLDRQKILELTKDFPRDFDNIEEVLQKLRDLYSQLKTNDVREQAHLHNINKVGFNYVPHNHIAEVFISNFAKQYFGDLNYKYLTGQIDIEKLQSEKDLLEREFPSITDDLRNTDTIISTDLRETYISLENNFLDTLDSFAEYGSTNLNLIVLTILSSQTAMFKAQGILEQDNWYRYVDRRLERIANEKYETVEDLSIAYNIFIRYSHEYLFNIQIFHLLCAEHPLSLEVIKYGKKVTAKFLHRAMLLISFYMNESNLESAINTEENQFAKILIRFVNRLNNKLKKRKISSEEYKRQIHLLSENFPRYYSVNEIKSSVLNPDTFEDEEILPHRKEVLVEELELVDEEDLLEKHLKQLLEVVEVKLYEFNPDKSKEIIRRFQKTKIREEYTSILKFLLKQNNTLKTLRNFVEQSGKRLEELKFEVPGITTDEVPERIILAYHIDDGKGTRVVSIVIVADLAEDNINLDFIAKDPDELQTKSGSISSDQILRNLENELSMRIFQYDQLPKNILDFIYEKREIFAGLDLEYLNTDILIEYLSRKIIELINDKWNIKNLEIWRSFIKLACENSAIKNKLKSNLATYINELPILTRKNDKNRSQDALKLYPTVIAEKILDYIIIKRYTYDDFHAFTPDAISILNEWGELRKETALKLHIGTNYRIHFIQNDSNLLICITWHGHK